MPPQSADRLDDPGTRRLRYGYYAAVVAYLGSWVVIAQAYRSDTRLLPVAVGVAALGLVGVRAVVARPGGDGPFDPGPTPDGTPTADIPNADTRRALVAFGWLAGLVAATVAVGIVPGVLLAVTGFVARYDRLRRAVVVGPATAAAVYVLFVLLLDLPSYDPAVVRLLGGVVGG